MGYRVAFVVLVACRGGSTPPPDIDASPDAPGIDTTVTLTRNDIPDVNQPVAFQNADGTVLALVMTDPSGVATAKLAEHATVSVLQPFQVSTFIDVPPGDHLTLVTYDDVAPTQQVTVAFPTDPNPTVTNHVVKVACGDLPGP